MACCVYFKELVKLPVTCNPETRLLPDIGGQRVALGTRSLPLGGGGAFDIWGGGGAESLAIKTVRKSSLYGDNTWYILLVLNLLFTSLG